MNCNTFKDQNEILNQQILSNLNIYIRDLKATKKNRLGKIFMQFQAS